MRKRQVWRYYCDFCKKAGLSGGHMKTHEKHCTGNPDRVCRFHAHCEDPMQPPLRLVMDALHQGGLEKAKEVSSDCPCCILAAIRATGLGKGTEDEDGYVEPVIQYDFKSEMKQKWSDIDDARMAEGGLY